MILFPELNIVVCLGVDVAVGSGCTLLFHSSPAQLNAEITGSFCECKGKLGKGKRRSEVSDVDVT